MFLVGLPIFKTKFSSVVLVGSDLTTTNSATIPSDVQAGDIIYFFNHKHDSAGTNLPNGVVSASGFTEIGDSGTGLVWRTVLTFKKATGSEGGTVLTGQSGGTGGGVGCAILVFRGVGAPVTTTSHLDVACVATNGNPPSQSCTAGSSTGDATLVIGVACARSIATPAFVTDTPASDAYLGGGTVGSMIKVGYNIYAKGTTPVNHTYDMADIGGTTLSSFYVELT